MCNEGEPNGGRAAVLNRSAVIVRPRKRYVDWANSLPGPRFEDTTQEDEIVYLVPAFETDAERDALLEVLWPTLFDLQLESWHTEESEWPQGRTLAMFQEWFTIDWHSMVEDLWQRPIVDS